jgi:hypothetical protein
VSVWLMRAVVCRRPLTLPVLLALRPPPWQTVTAMRFTCLRQGFRHNSPHSSPHTRRVTPTPAPTPLVSLSLPLPTTHAPRTHTHRRPWRSCMTRTSATSTRCHSCASLAS